MDIRLIIVQAFVILFAITVHEAAHAWTAAKLGDPTAAALGRASLNPLVHIDPIGTVIFPLILIIFKMPVFGWAKPVPYNPYNLRHPKKGGLWISSRRPGRQPPDRGRRRPRLPLPHPLRRADHRPVRPRETSRGAEHRPALHGPDQHLARRLQPHPRPAPRRQRHPGRPPLRPGRCPVRAAPALRLPHPPRRYVQRRPEPHLRARPESDPQTLQLACPNPPPRPCRSRTRPSRPSRRPPTRRTATRSAWTCSKARSTSSSSSSARRRSTSTTSPSPRSPGTTSTTSSTRPRSTSTARPNSCSSRRCSSTSSRRCSCPARPTWPRARTRAGSWSTASSSTRRSRPPVRCSGSGRTSRSSSGSGTSSRRSPARASSSRWSSPSSTWPSPSSG